MALDVLRWALATCDAGQRVVLASVVTTTGSVPGKAGAKLALCAGPTWVGTVGGAGLEERVKAAMLERLHAPGRPMGEVLTYGLHRGAKGYEVVALDSLCGGRVTVSIDVLNPTPHVLLMGGGHCAVAFAKVADQLGWRTSVQDSREAYADDAHHPAAMERHVTSVEAFLAAENATTLTRFTDILLLGHDHAEDRARLHGLLEHLNAAGLTPGQDGAPRIGCIGSRAKWTSFRNGCLESGLPEALVEAVVCPIGLNIGAETPEEIAVAVAASIMASEAGLAPGEPTWRDAM
tara:strand:+ start:2113 stop:2985 length:873 start_codon:yes stop_codon:yes gene_type:complete